MNRERNMTGERELSGEDRRSGEQSENPLDQEFTLFSLLKFALPTIGMMLFMGFYTITDTVFVSRFVDTNALSALNIVCPVINLIVGLGTMLATGGSAVVAKKMGEGNIDRAKADFTLIVLFGVALGVVIAVLGTVLLEDIVWGLGSSSVLYPYCREYLLVILLFTPASMLQVLFQNLIVTAGKPGFGLVLSMGAGAANIILDYIFMVPLDMGVKGAALGTGIGYVIPAAAGIFFFMSRKGTLSFTKPSLDVSVLRKSCGNGASEMVSQISTAVTTFFFNLTMMRLLGENGVASITILIYTQFLLTTLYIGFSMGIAPVISFHYGAGYTLRLKKIFRMALGFILSSSLLIFLISMTGRQELVRLFTGREKEVYQITTAGFQIFAFSFLFSGINIFSSAAFTALSNGKISAAISFLRTFGFLMIGLIVLPHMLGVTGVWLAVPLAEAFTFCTALVLMKRSAAF